MTSITYVSKTSGKLNLYTTQKHCMLSSQQKLSMNEKGLIYEVFIITRLIYNNETSGYVLLIK